MADHVYHWKHGWIPLDHAAALSKAKGSEAGAQKHLAAVKHEDLPRSPHVMAAHAPNGRFVLHDTKTNPSTSITQSQAHAIHSGGHKVTGVHNGEMKVERQGAPNGLSVVGPTTKVPASDVHEGDIVHSPGLGGKTNRLRVDKTFSVQSDGSRNVDVTNLETGRKSGITLEPHKQHVVERPKH